jgi:hypothetical protein
MNIDMAMQVQDNFPAARQRLTSPISLVAPLYVSAGSKIETVRT